MQFFTFSVKYLILVKYNMFRLMLLFVAHSTIWNLHLASFFKLLTILENLV